jgi:hypothetical protein
MVVHGPTTPSGGTQKASMDAGWVLHTSRTQVAGRRAARSSGALLTARSRRLGTWPRRMRKPGWSSFSRMPRQASPPRRLRSSWCPCARPSRAGSPSARARRASSAPPSRVTTICSSGCIAISARTPRFATSPTDGCAPTSRTSSLSGSWARKPRRRPRPKARTSARCTSGAGRRSRPAARPSKWQPRPRRSSWRTRFRAPGSTGAVAPTALCR